MRYEGIIYVAGHPLLNRRATRLLGCIRLRNDLYCVGWGVKLYSRTHPSSLFACRALDYHWIVATCFQQRVGFAAAGFIGGFVLYALSLLTVRRRGKNIDSSSKSNPLRRRRKKLRRVDVKV